MNDASHKTLDLVNQLQEEAASFGIDLDAHKAELTVQHLLLVIEKNKVLNLTRIVDEHDGITKHVVDSLLFAKALARVDVPAGSFLDIGTGAGFPGIPFAIETNRAGVLLDSVTKKVAAVTEFIKELGLEEGLDAQAARVEDYAREHRGAYAVVTARAVAKLNVLIEYAAPLLRKNGVLVVSKGQIDDEEYSDGEYAAKLCGLKHVSRETYELPHDAGHRELIVYRKVTKPSLKLPRKVGMAKHNPLTQE